MGSITDHQMDYTFQVKVRSYHTVSELENVLSKEIRRYVSGSFLKEGYEPEVYLLDSVPYVKPWEPPKVGEAWRTIYINQPREILWVGEYKVLVQMDENNYAPGLISILDMKQKWERVS